MPGQLEAPSLSGRNELLGRAEAAPSHRASLGERPKIYVFDDSFSALDFKTDAALRAALNDEVDDAIVFIVAQRVSTIMNAERIIVLDKGEIVGMGGTHEELMKLCSVYREIVLSQLSEEEVA